MRIDVFTIFPDMVSEFAGQSLLGRASAKGLLDVRVHDLREHTTDVHRTVDDSPFGGGAGMVLRPEPIYASVEAVDPPRPLFLLGPGGRRLDQAMAQELAESGGFLIVDWKSGSSPKTEEELAARAIQLALYRIAFAKWQQIGVEKVTASFFFAADGKEIMPNRLLSEVELVAALEKAKTARRG